MNGILDYSLCAQTVTLYHRQGNTVQRQVVEGCYYTWEEKQVADVYGVRCQTLCRLILPGDAHRVYVGDRVYPGVGPEISIADWPGFLPVSVTGLAQIDYVTPCCWEGAVCHIEAGRK